AGAMSEGSQAAAAAAAAAATPIASHATVTAPKAANAAPVKAGASATAAHPAVAPVPGQAAGQAPTGPGAAPAVPRGAVPVAPSPGGNFASDVGVTADTITLGLINFRSATRALGPVIADATSRMVQATIQWINDHGGVAGRKLKLETCDDGGDVTRGRACF